MATQDSFDLNRFVTAQDPVWPDVLAELEQGRKRTHWMWFVFPQLKGLGHSSMARHYALGSVEEAQAYLAHTVLGPRLHAATALVLRHRNKRLRDIFGTPDDLKFISSMTVFDQASGTTGTQFATALRLWNDGKPDNRT